MTASRAAVAAEGEDRVPPAILSLVLDATHLPGDVPARVAALVEAGVDWLQVRDRSLEAAALHVFVDGVLAGARAGPRGARVVVNRRIDVALSCGADGVHLGFDAMCVADARALLPASALVGVSGHSPGDVQRAAAEGADYVHLAPIFDPISKPAERPALGLGALREAAAMGIRVLAQGGLDPARARAALDAGAAGVAITGDILMAPDPVAAARLLREAMDSH
jgi:thiamine-phosphate pyrophosphorylase